MATGTRHRAEPARSWSWSRVARRAHMTLQRRVLPSQPFALLALTLLTVAVSLLSRGEPMAVPPTALVLVMMVGGFLLRLRALGLLYLVVAAATLLIISNDRGEEVLPGEVAVLVGSAVVVLLFARSRERLGVQGTAGDTMLVDMRDRLRAQDQVPGQMPPGWHVERELRPAYGDSFSGDFLVASRSGDGQLLEMVLVDVSGKGQPAGTRALLLSGAFGGLLGALGREQFLPAANAYLLHQDWDEGFATAVHLAVDLGTGGYRIASAGHPPAAHYHAGSGRWEVISSDHGPALGIVEDVGYPAHTARLQRGDALLLYTDGLVETPGRDLGLGIDRLVGQAESLVAAGGFAGGARRIVDATRDGENDDRGLVLIWRD